MNKYNDSEKERLNKLLWTRINQYKMLNNTLTEMIANNGNGILINSIKNEIDETLDEIQKIKFDLIKDESTSVKEEDVTYSFYDDIVKTVLPDKETKLKDTEDRESDCYDSVVRQSKAAEFKMAEYSKRDKTNLDYEYNNRKKGITKEVNITSNKYVDEINKTIGSRIMSNRFLVKFSDVLEIPEIMVKSVSFDPNEKSITITVYDFVKEIDGMKYPILQLLKFAKGSFSFDVEHLDASGNVIYTEKYVGVNIEGVYRDPIDYSDSEFSTIQIFATYKDVDYEAAN